MRAVGIILNELLENSPRMVNLGHLERWDKGSIETANAIRMTEVVAAAFMLGCYKGALAVEQKMTEKPNLDGLKIARGAVARYWGAAGILHRIGIQARDVALKLISSSKALSILEVLERGTKRFSSYCMDQIWKTLDSISLRLAEEDLDPLARRSKYIDEVKNSGLDEFYKETFLNVEVFAYNLGVLYSTWNNDKIGAYKFNCEEKELHPICEIRHGMMIEKDPSLVLSNIPPLHENCLMILEPLKISDAYLNKWTKAYDEKYPAYPLYSGDESLTEVVKLILEEGDRK